MASGRLVVVVNGTTAPDALVEVALWRGADGWLDRRGGSSRYQTVVVRAEEGVAQAVFESLAYRDYAVTAYQDDNENGSLDTGILRIPKERLGFSNGVRPRFSAPKYEDAAVMLQDPELEIEIILNRMP